MKTRRIVILFASIFTVILITSCNKKDEVTNNRTYLNNLTGTYLGEFTAETVVSGITGTADVAIINNNQLQVHCYGNSIDTTFVMDTFENEDSIMVCDTAEDLNAPYGIMGNGNHMMGMDSEESEWMLHMEYDPHAADEHYGSFDMTHHSFQYSFDMMEGDSIYKMNFYGTKQE